MLLMFNCSCWCLLDCLCSCRYYFYCTSLHMTPVISAHQLYFSCIFHVFMSTVTNQQWIKSLSLSMHFCTAFLCTCVRSHNKYILHRHLDESHYSDFSWQIHLQPSDIPTVTRHRIVGVKYRLVRETHFWQVWYPCNVSCNCYNVSAIVAIEYCLHWIII